MSEGVAPDERLDGVWVHGDARGTELAVVHQPTGYCGFAGRHPISTCWYWPPERRRALDG